MRYSKRSVSVLLALGLTATAFPSSGDGFVRVAPNLAMATERVTLELKRLAWKNLDGAWSPSQAEVQAAFDHLRTTQGNAEVLSTALPTMNMAVSLRRIPSSLFQVFGVINKGRKCLLFEALPKNDPIDPNDPNLWLKEIISVRVLDGGSAFWWVMYDVSSHRFVDCNRRPD